MSIQISVEKPPVEKKPFEFSDLPSHIVEQNIGKHLGCEEQKTICKIIHPTPGPDRNLCFSKAMPQCLKENIKKEIQKFYTEKEKLPDYEYSWHRDYRLMVQRVGNYRWIQQKLCTVFFYGWRGAGESTYAMYHSKDVQNIEVLGLEIFEHGLGVVNFDFEVKTDKLDYEFDYKTVGGLEVLTNWEFFPTNDYDGYKQKSSIPPDFSLLQSYQTIEFNKKNAVLTQSIDEALNLIYERAVFPPQMVSMKDKKDEPLADLLSKFIQNKKHVINPTTEEEVEAAQEKAMARINLINTYKKRLIHERRR